MLAVAEQVGVDELAPAIAVDGQQLEGEQAAHHQELLEHPLLGLVGHRSDLGPLRTAVGGQQGVGKLPLHTAAVVTDQIHPEGADRHVLPLAEGADRDLQHQRPGGFLRVAAPAQREFAFLGAQQPIDGRRADAQQLGAYLGGKRDLALAARVPALVVRQPEPQRGRQPFAAQVAEVAPQLGQRGDDLLVVHPRRALP